MNVIEQYDLIEPDTITDVLKERGWEYVGDDDIWSVYKNARHELVFVADGDQTILLEGVLKYEGPEAVAEIWARSSGFLAPLMKYKLACEAGLPRKKIYCYFCGARHIDKDVWAKRPHHTHRCETCGKTFDVGEWSFGA